MNKKLLLVLAVTSGCFALPTPDFIKSRVSGSHGFLKQVSSLFKNGVFSQDNLEMPIESIREFLNSQADNLRPPVIDKVMASVECARQKNAGVNHILTIIDYSLPSNEKRLWVFDLKNKELLFHTYVSHGLTSGSLHTEFFSNKYDSKASSVGIYKTAKSYYGREGLSLRLDGLDRGFNDNAQGRYIVMHGGWYMDENFIKKYGRPGRSWGCPAMPLDVAGSVINTIKENSLLVVYYPDEHWLSTSKYLNCNNFSMLQNVLKTDRKSTTLLPTVQREPILFLDLNKNNKREENEPVLVMEADNYQREFNTEPPLARMLRRQMDKAEYIALTQVEFEKILLEQTRDSASNQSFDKLFFIIPVIKMKRGYYETEMHTLPLGKIKNARVENNGADKKFILDFDNKSSVNLKNTGQFIRWLGL